jgi:ligand-binding sensor domain-containing protein
MIKYFTLKPIYSILFVIACHTLCSGQTKTGLEQMFRCSLLDKSGNLWFGTTGKGVYRYNAATADFTNFTKREGLSDNSVSAIIEDKAGNIWFGTANGVCRYDGKSFAEITKNESLCNRDINAILEDKNGNFWFGTNGWGVCRYVPSADTVGGIPVTNFTMKDGLGSDAIQCILEDKAGNIWFGERAGGVSRYESASSRITKVKGTCFSSQIMSIIEDKTGNIWFANLYDGLCRFDPFSSEFTHFTEKDGICGNIVTCLYENKNGILWFSSNSGQPGNRQEGGLCRFDGKSFIQFTSKDGIIHSEVWTIVEDNDGNIWVGTKGGLYRYHSPSGKFIDYTYKL